MVSKPWSYYELQAGGIEAEDPIEEQPAAAQFVSHDASQMPHSQTMNANMSQEALLMSST